MTKSIRFAKLLRVLTAPPVLAAALAVILKCFRSDLFIDPAQLWISLIMLAFLPSAAYPLQELLPKLRGGGRDVQRKLAFLMTVIGYVGAALLGRLTHAPKELQMLYDTYGLSVCLLTLINKGFHIKASGHACGTVAALIFSIVLISPTAIFPSLVICAGAAWASLITKRHTPQELIFGVFTCIAAYAIVFFCYLLKG